MRLIDADELITAFPVGETVRTESVRATIYHMPTIEPKKGKWIEQTDINSKLYGWYRCSECGAVIGIETNFCSECGADMKGEEDETD